MLTYFNYEIKFFPMAMGGIYLMQNDPLCSIHSIQYIVYLGFWFENEDVICMSGQYCMQASIKA